MTETKIFDAGGDFSSGAALSAPGFLKWTFILRKEAVLATAKKGVDLDDPDYIKRLVGSFWPSERGRPAPNEVVSISFSSLDERRFRVEAVVKRGHWFVSDFLLNHPDAVVWRKGDSIFLDAEGLAEPITFRKEALP